MNRFALLIDSSDVAGKTDLPGAREDVKNWKSYLQSELGGSWKDDEIITRNKPLSSEVQRLLKSNSSKYCFVAFAGHGEHKPYSGDTVCLNEQFMACPISKITPLSSRGVVVIDACRWVDDAILIESLSASKSASVSNRAVVANSLQRDGTFNYMQYKTAQEKIADKWFDALNKSQTGIVTMFACSKGEDADDIRDENNAETGGVYTTLLVKFAKDWERKAGSTSIYSTKNAHDDAARYMKVNFSQQTPQYSPLALSYPFAVK